MKKQLLSLFMMSGAFALNAQWTPQNSGFPTMSTGCSDIEAISANVAWVVGYDGSGGGASIQDFARTTDGGVTWTPGVVTPAAALALSFSNICALGKDTAWVAMYDGANGGGGIFKTVDGGANWTPQTTAVFTPPNGFPNVVHFWNANTGFAMGDPNGGYFEVYTTPDGGTTWTRVPQANLPAPLSGEYGYADQYSVVGNTVWFGTNKGRVFKSIDKGLNWTVATTGFADLQGFDMKDANNGLCRNAKQVKKTIDGGATWTAVTNVNFTSQIASVPGTNTFIATGAATGAAGSAYTYNMGATWVTIDSAIQHTAVDFFDATTGWSGGFNSGNNDGIFKWTGANLSVNNLSGTNVVANIYPNPATDNLYIQLNGADKKDVVVTIVNQLGEVVKQVILENSNDFFIGTVKVADLANGFYLINVQNGVNYLQHKVIVK